MITKLTDRFEQLSKELPALEGTKRTVHSEYGSSVKMDDEGVLTWKVKAKNLLVAACGTESQHFSEFLVAEKIGSWESTYDTFKRMKSVFLAAMDDYNGGYLTSIRNLVQADVFENELEQAEELLKNGYKVAAAVIAGVVLETSIRDFCTQNGIATGKLDKMNADLAKAGIYNKLQQKRITALADIRNSAAHGNPGEFSDADVQSMIRDVESILASLLA